MNITQELNRLREEYGATLKKFERLGVVISDVATLVGIGPPGKTQTAVIPMPHPAKHRLTAAGRRNIANAQEARWNKAKHAA
jgi:hypothetical protein